MTTALFLIFLGTIVRLIPHVPNIVPMTALSLYAGARLPRKWSYVVPIVAMAASDLWLDWGSGLPALNLTRITAYATFVLTVWLGSLVRETRSPISRPAMAVVASTVFFLTTNLAVWLSPQVASPGHPTFGPTLSGLLQCYASALPFFRTSLIADLIGTVLLFGVDGAVRYVSGRLRPRPVAVAPPAA